MSTSSIMSKETELRLLLLLLLLYVDAFFEDGEIKAYVTAPELDEISGMAASWRHRDVLYTVLDSEGPHKVFAIDARDGRLIATLNIIGATNCDWEEISVGPGPGGYNYIYIGDIGGNVPAPCFTVYRVREPELMQDSSLEVDSKISFSWNSRDCEAMFVDNNGEVFLVSKVWPRETPRLYQVPSEGWGLDTRVPLGNGIPVAINSSTVAPLAADMSRDGTEIIMKSLDSVLYWRRRPFKSLSDTLQEQPTVLPYNMEPQGESLCFDFSGEGFYTVSEGEYPPLWYYRRVSRGLW